MTILGASLEMHNARPFAGQGVSLYVTPGTTVRYRRLRLGRSRRILRQGWRVRTPKTLRVAVQSGESDDTVTLNYELPAALAETNLVIDVRHFRDGVENLTSNAGVVPLSLDADREAIVGIHGTCTWLAPVAIVGGVVKLYWVWHPADEGVQPTTFRVEFTSGPSAPDDLLVMAEGAGTYTIATVALDDSAAYTIKLWAETATESTLLTTQSITADASGPPAPTLVSARAH